MVQVHTREHTKKFTKTAFLCVHVTIYTEGQTLNDLLQCLSLSVQFPSFYKSESAVQNLLTFITCSKINKKHLKESYILSKIMIDDVVTLICLFFTPHYHISCMFPTHARSMLSTKVQEKFLKKKCRKGS